MKLKKKNKIIASILALVLTFSMLLPDFSNLVIASASSDEAVINEMLVPSTSYTDSGQVVENPETGTDLDNFNVNLRFGTITDAIEGDSLHVKDQSIKIPVVITIEYTGETPYAAGDIALTFDNTLGFMHRNASSSIISDVGAELVGSSSGRGDWYYTQQTSTSIDTLIFENKNATTGAFTSSIEVYFQMPACRQIINGFSGEITLSLNIVNSTESRVARTLFVSAETTHDSYALNDITSTVVGVSTWGTKSNPGKYYGYSLNNYHIMKITLNRTIVENNREGSLSSVLTLPEGVYIAYSTQGSSYTQAVGTIKSSNIDYTLAVSKDLYAAGDSINIKWEGSATFLDTNEVWSQVLEKEVTVTETSISYNSNSIWPSIDFPDLYRYEVNRSEGKDFEWILDNCYNKAFGALGDVENYGAVQTTISHTNFYLYEDGTYNSSKKFLPDQYYLRYIDINEYASRKFLYGSDNDVIFNIYVRPSSTSTWTLVKQVSSTEFCDGITGGHSYRVDLDVSQRYQYFKIVIDGQYLDQVGSYNNSAFYFDIGTHMHIDPETEPYLNNENHTLYFRPVYSGSQTMTNGNTVSKSYASDIKFLEATGTPYISSSSASYKSVLNSRIRFYTSFTSRKNISVNSSDWNSFRNTEYYGEITIPSIFEFDVKDIKDISFSFYTSYSRIYHEETDSYISGSNTNNKLDEIINYDKSTYEIINNGDTKTLKVKYVLNDGYYGVVHTAYSSYVTIGAYYYMDLDTYSGLLSLSKLPTSMSVINTTYKLEEGNFANLTWSKDSVSKTTTFKMPTLAGSTFEGIELFSNTGSGYSKDIQTTENKKNYSYKLRFSGSQMTADNIVFYDNLEMAYGSNDKYFQGTFKGLDTTLLDMYCEGENYIYTIYYSTNPNQVFDLTDPGWVEASQWTDELSAVKSFAVDLGDFKLPAASVVYVIVNMETPEFGNVGMKAYNSYSVDYKAYDATTGTLMEDVKAFSSNTTEIIIDGNINYTINKTWSGEKKEQVEVNLLANDVIIETIILKADNNWTHMFEELPVLDDNKNIIKYSVEEISINKYDTTYQTSTDSNGNITTTITNSRIPDQYSFVIDWITEGKENIVLGLINSDVLTPEEQLALRANNVLTVKASADNKETVTFEVTADNEGLITIPDAYNDYTNFSVEINDSEKMYICKYEINYTNPEFPESIYLQASEDAYDSDNNIYGDMIFITAAENWQASYYFKYSNITFEVMFSDYPSNITISELEDGKYKVEVINTGAQIANIVSSEISENIDITISKDWNINEDYIKINIKNTLGYAANFDYVEIVNADETTVLETIKGSTDLGLIVSANKYSATDSYQAKVYLVDGTVHTIDINSENFEIIPVEVEVLVDSVSQGIFELNEDNNWSYTISVLPGNSYEVIEKTTGNWTYEVASTDNGYVVTNTVVHEIEVADITVSAPEEIIDTGNESTPSFVYIVFLIGLAGLGLALIIPKKKK